MSFERFGRAVIDSLQIWFQNRRQNDRRKSRPLLPHEMVPHFRNSVPQVLLDTHLPNEDTPTEPHQVASSVSEFTTSPGAEVPERTSSRASSINDLLNPSSSIESHTTKAAFDSPQAEKDVPQSSQSSVSGVTRDAPGSETKGLEDDGVRAGPRSEDVKVSPTGVKRAFDQMTGQRGARKDATAVQVPRLVSQASTVRLSMSLDGAVKVKTNDEDTPSPPKQRAPAPTFTSKPAGGLKRSQSAFVFGGSTTEEPVVTPKTRPMSGQFGRSRDARTWEFYCDSDARDALASHAENERTGSAAGAISLIRSQSQKARALAMTERVDGNKTRKSFVSQSNGKPKLSRAKSSMARLQDTGVTLSQLVTKDGQRRHVRSPSGDSDKENWAPGTHMSNHPLRRQHTNGSGRPILRDHVHASSYARSLTETLADDQKRRGLLRQRSGVKPRASALDKENLPLSEEHGKGEDLDCVQGLLSLSQGAWQ